jgi:hypothetical protein
LDEEVITPEQIVNLVRERESLRGVWFAGAEEARQMYNGDVVVPLPELEANSLQASS